MIEFVGSQISGYYHADSNISNLPAVCAANQANPSQPRTSQKIIPAGERRRGRSMLGKQHRSARLRDTTTPIWGLSWANDNFNPRSFQVLLKDLAEIYMTDPMSKFSKKRWVTQVNYRSLTRRVVDEFGDHEIEKIKMRMLVDAHARWSADGKVTMGHGIVSMFRILIGFGAGILEDEHCQRIKGALGSVRFQNGKPRKSIVTFDQVERILEHATRQGHYSIALAQAIQFGCAFRQKDVIGEYVPVDVDPRPSNIILGNFKWVGGITREEVNDDLLLTHETSKKGKVLSFPLRSIPIIMEEWKHAPKSGPLIIDPRTGKPFRPWNYTRIWRDLADKAGVPRNVVQMDTRAGRITALLAMGIPIEDVKKFVGHSQSQTTAGYSRDNDGAIVRVAEAAREAA